jgi:hypothetical protein
MLLLTAIAAMGAAADDAKLADIATIQPVISTIQMRPDWEEIEVKTALPRDYSLTLWYRENATVMQGQPEGDTKLVARAILKGLVGAGHSPADESLGLYISAMRRVRGETGKTLVRWYGYTSYDYNRDALRYTACDGKGWFGC